MRGFVFCYTAGSLIKVVIIMLIFEGKEIETDTEGYLKESSQWSEPLAVVIAENEGIRCRQNTGKWCVLCVISIWNSILLRRFVCW